jgi:hypothetical protein
MGNIVFGNLLDLSVAAGKSRFPLSVALWVALRVAFELSTHSIMTTY